MPRIATVSCVLLLLLGFTTSNPLLRKERDTCWASGTCRRVRHCPPAIQAIQQGRPTPQRCGFVGMEEVVCCPEPSSSVADRGQEVINLEHTTNESRTSRGVSNDIATDDDLDSSPAQRPSEAACTSFHDKRGGLDDYIILGKLSGEQEFPHMAALGYNVPNTEGLSWLCGGTLISDQFVLTAAHCCASRITGRPIRVRLGARHLTATADDVDYEISQIVMHPNYRKRHYYSDIALLKLNRKVAFSESVFPACLNTLEGDPLSFTAAGWGATNTVGTRLSSALMKTTIHPFALSDCQNAFKEKFPRGMDSSLICAGDPQGKTDTCNGDSGGPLVTGNAAPYKVFGITSVGPKPCGGAIPSVYTRVSHYLDWIEQRVWP